MRLDLDTLVWTRGAAFPVSMLEGRSKCPACGSRRVVLLFSAGQAYGESHGISNERPT
jgi:hypothetical protein